MFEKHTDRARKALDFANHEAQRLNHEYIGPEHILLGLLKEGSGVACTVLRALDISLSQIRLDVKKLVSAGPEIVTMGKVPMTPEAKRIVEAAIKASRDFGVNYVGTEHYLFALAQSDGVAGQVLANHRATPDVLRPKIIEILAGDKVASSGTSPSSASQPESIPRPPTTDPAKESGIPSETLNPKNGRSLTALEEEFWRCLENADNILDETKPAPGFDGESRATHARYWTGRATAIATLMIARQTGLR